MSLRARMVRAAPYPDPTEQESALEEAAEAAAEDGRIDDANRFEAHLWLDGPTSPDGRVQGAARQLFLDMNGRALRSPDPGPPAASPDAWPRLAEIAVPTCVLSGDLDTSDLRAIARQLAAEIPAATFVELARTAHLPQPETPSELTARIVTFVESLA